MRRIQRDGSQMKTGGTTRRQLLTAIGMVGGSAALYQAMTTMGHASETQFAGPPNLSGARAGASVVVLGAGLAGMLAAYELSKAGYKVRILEYQARAGGRNWSLYGGDTYTELGGATQKVSFDKGHYLNPGPWRIPYHHRTLLHYCKAFGVALEPFIQFNHNAFVHSADAFGGKPVRYREAAADFEGNIAELLGKAIDQKALDSELTRRRPREADGSLARLGHAGCGHALQKRPSRLGTSRLRAAAGRRGQCRADRLPDFRLSRRAPFEGLAQHGVFHEP